MKATILDILECSLLNLASLETKVKYFTDVIGPSISLLLQHFTTPEWK